jgi:Bifunctional DNA primase/polymerase, N-terminal
MRDWPNEASPHLGDVHRWLRRGLRVGMTLDHWAAIDLDPLPALEPLEEEFGRLPATWTQRTPSGGAHLLYRRPLDRCMSRVGWRRYAEGAVDIKAGPQAYIVLYRGLPNLELAAELPDEVAQALPQGSVQRTAICTAEWADWCKATAHYRPDATTRAYLEEDVGRMAGSGAGEQRRLLNALGFKWGQKVARWKVVGAGEAFWRLCEGARRMRNHDPADPWELGAVQDCLRCAMLRGALSNPRLRP